MEELFGLMPLIEDRCFGGIVPAEVVVGGGFEDVLKAAGTLTGGGEFLSKRDIDLFDARLVDLWVPSNGGAPFRLIERPHLESSIGLHGLLEVEAQFDLGDGKALRANSSPSGGGDYVDSNGNGQWDEGEEIIVNGKRPKKMDEDGDGGDGGGWPWEPNPGGDIGGNPPSGGGGGDQPWNQQTEEADDTPCVDEVPAGANLGQLNNLAKHLGTVLSGLQDSTDNEWGAFVYRASNGQLYQSEPFTAGRHDSMDGAIGHIPSGATIVGYLHTHPSDAAMDERMLSDDDREFIRDLIDSGRADSNLLAYVVTKDNETDYHTYVYDKSRRNSETKGCDL